MRTTALVPLRSGSKGIPGKNTRIFHGRPLFSWAVVVGHEVCDETWVTTDDPSLEHLVRLYGGRIILRPEELATDETPMFPVVLHALETLPRKPDAIVLLQPTSPWRTSVQVQMAVALLETSGADSVVSVVEIPQHLSPDRACMMRGDRLQLPAREVTRRQDARPAYVRDGTVYAIKRETVEQGSLYGKDCRGLIIPRSQSVTLDTEADWAHAVSSHVGRAAL